MVLGISVKEKFSKYWEKLIMQIWAYDKTPASIINITVACRNLEEFTKEIGSKIDKYRLGAKALEESLSRFRAELSAHRMIFETRQQIAQLLFMLVVNKNLRIKNWDEFHESIKKKTIIERLAA